MKKNIGVFFVCHDILSIIFVLFLNEKKFFLAFLCLLITIIPMILLFAYDIPVLKLKKHILKGVKKPSETEYLLAKCKYAHILSAAILFILAILYFFFCLPLSLSIIFILLIPVLGFILTFFINEEEFTNDISHSLFLANTNPSDLQKKFEMAKNPNFQTNMENPTKLLFSFDGGVANRVEVYEDHCVLVAVKNTRALMTGNILNGNKEFYYSDLTSIQFKPATKMINGYIQFEYPGSHSGKGPDNFISENSFAFMLAKISNEEISEAVRFIKQKIRTAKVPQQQNIVMNPISEADEIEKFKNLLDKGVITQEEFEAKKKQIFGL